MGTRLPTAGGTYALLLASVRCGTLGFGRRGHMTMLPGCYVYVGSAFGPGGLQARVGRNLRREKTLRWHVDYLRARTSPEAIWLSEPGERAEHAWASALAQANGAIAVPDFGCSDCDCGSHLFHFAQAPAPELLRPARVILAPADVAAEASDASQALPSPSRG